MATVAQIAGEVAREWAVEGRVAVPPAVDSPEDDAAFWAEVARRAETEVEEAFNPHQPRYPKGHPKAGQWRPKLTTGRGRVAPGHLENDLFYLKNHVKATTDLYGGNVPTHKLNEVGLEVEKIALRYSARSTYEKRLTEMRAERTAIQDRKWHAWETFFHDPDTTPEMVDATEPEHFLTRAEVKKLRDIQDEEVRLLRERDRADRDAMLGVLQQLRPMGGKLKQVSDKPKVDRASGIETKYTEEELARGAAPAVLMQRDLDESLKEVLKHVPTAWLEDTNAKGEVRWLFSADRAWASTTRTEEKRPKDQFRAMEEAVDAALEGKLPAGLVSQASVDLSREQDPFPQEAADAYKREHRHAHPFDEGPEVEAWRKRRDERRDRLASQRYTWVGRTAVGNQNYPQGIWAVIEGEDDGNRYYLDWGGNLHLMRPPREDDSPVEKGNLSQKVTEGKRVDLRIKGPVPITERQRDAIRRYEARGGKYMGLYDNRWPVVQREGGVEGGVGPNAPIYDWLDDEGHGKNMQVEDVAPPGGFDSAKWDRDAPIPPVVKSTVDTQIKIRPKDRAVLMHELAHRLEVVYGDENRAGFRPIEFATNTWLTNRTQGEALQKLQDLYPGYAYEDHEMARPDRFVDGYVGKDYPGGTTEVLTMGMDMLFFPRYGERDINKDPEHRRLILGMLAAL